MQSLRAFIRCPALTRQLTLPRQLTALLLGLACCLAAPAAPAAAAPAGRAAAAKVRPSVTAPAATPAPPAFVQETPAATEPSSDLWDYLKGIFGDDTNTQSGGGKPGRPLTDRQTWKVLSPLQGKHVLPPPSVRWLRMAGIPSYRLTLQQGQRTLWSQVVAAQPPAPEAAKDPVLSVPLPASLWSQVTPSVPLRLTVEALELHDGALKRVAKVRISFELLSAEDWRVWQDKAEQQAAQLCPGPTGPCDIPCERLRPTLIFGMALQEELFTEAERMATGGLPWCTLPAAQVRSRGRVDPTIDPEAP